MMISGELVEKVSACAVVRLLILIAFEQEEASDRDAEGSKTMYTGFH